MAMQMATTTTLAQVAAWPTTMDALKVPRATVSKEQVGKGCAITINNLGILYYHVGSWSITYRYEDRGIRGVSRQGGHANLFQGLPVGDPMLQPARGE